MLKVNKLTVRTAEGEKKLVENANFVVKPGKISLLIGPNGAGKSTVAKSLIHSPDLEISEDSEIVLDGKILTKAQPENISKNGLFVSFQNPVEIPGVKVLDFLQSSYNSRRDAKDRVDIWDMLDLIEECSKEVGITENIADRNVNEGFSGGEKKKFELLQILLNKPKYAVLDEIDSGADVDTIQTIYSTVSKLAEKYKTGFLIISHNPQILNSLNVTTVYLMENGKIKNSGGEKLAKETFEKGFLNK